MLKTTTFCFVLISCALLTFGYEERDIPTTATVVSNPFQIISYCSSNPTTNSEFESEFPKLLAQLELIYFFNLFIKRNCFWLKFACTTRICDFGIGCLIQ